MLEARGEGVQAVADEDDGDAAEDDEEDDYFVGEVLHVWVLSACDCELSWDGCTVYCVLEID